MDLAFTHAGAARNSSFGGEQAKAWGLERVPLRTFPLEVGNRNCSIYFDTDGMDLILVALGEGANGAKRVPCEILVRETGYGRDQGREVDAVKFK